MQSCAVAYRPLFGDLCPVSLLETCGKAQTFAVSLQSWSQSHTGHRPAQAPRGAQTLVVQEPNSVAARGQADTNLGQESRFDIAGGVGRIAPTQTSP